MKRAAMLTAIFLLLSITGAWADSLPPLVPAGPTWDITAAGIFSAGGPQSEAFALNWTLTFLSYGPGSDSVMPSWSGTTVFTGVLGTFTSVFSGVPTSPADFGYVPFYAPAAEAEIDFPVSDYTSIPLSQAYKPPTVGSPYLYSCFVPTPCEAFGTQVGLGLFVGGGPIVQTAKEVPEPTAPVLVVVGGMMLIGIKHLSKCFSLAPFRAAIGS